ncbi:hypothetical protein EBL89_06735 [Cereibacter sphaeroides]|nr:hypothetical protein EBL89_06735 [Cereibacter sphaeroides]AZB59277.1 hypothetical protein EBL88_06675 [Cereibacter sphaeroides]
MEGFQGNLAAAFEAVDQGIAEANSRYEAAIAAGLRGWLKDPTFSEWSDDALNPDNWSSIQLAHAAPFAGRFGGGLEVDAPAGASEVSLAAKPGAGMEGADLLATHAVVSLHVEHLVGNPAQSRLRLEWSDDGVAWTSDDAGSFADHGITPRVGVIQVIEALIARPESAPPYMRLVFSPRALPGTDPVHMRVHLLNIRAATAAEVEAGRVAGLSSAVDQQAETISTLGSTVASLSARLTSEVEGVYSTLESDFMTAAGVSQAIALASQTLSSQIGDVNARLTNEHYTRSQADQAISSAANTLQSSLNTLTNPKDFSQDGAFWSHNITGPLDTKPSLGDPVQFVSDSAMGRVARLAGPLTGNRHFVPKVYTPNTAGVRYRAVIVARHNGAFFGNSAQALRFLVRKIGGSYNAGGDIFASSLVFTAAETAKTFTVEWTCDGTSAYFVPFCYITTELASGVSIDIQSVDVVNISAAADAAAEVQTVKSDLETNFLTAAKTNQAIAAAETRMSGSIESVNASVQGFQAIADAVAAVVAGASVNVSLGGAALGQKNTLIVRDNSVARVNGQSTSGAAFTIETARALLFSGQRIKIGVLAKRPSSNAAARFAVAFATDDSGNSGQMISGPLTDAWEWHIFYWDVPVAIRGGPSYLGVFGDHNSGGRSVQVARVYVEIAAVAGELPEIQTLSGAVTDIKGLDLNKLSGTALANLLTQLEVKANGKSAMVEAQGTAIADLKGNASASYVFRTRAGSANAMLELVTADKPNGPVSVARISATDILLQGSVSMDMLVITDTSGNLVQNGAMPFGDARGWGPMPPTLQVVPRDPASQYGPIKTAPTANLLRLDPSENPAYVEIGKFDINGEGERFSCEYDAAAAIATGTHIGIQFVWFAADGQQISTTARSTVITYGGWQHIVTPPVAAPVGAARALLRAIRWGDSLPSIGLLTNLQVLRQRSGATMLTPNSITAGLLAAEQLITLTAQIGEAVVDTLTIRGQAVTVPAYAYTQAPVTLSGVDVQVSLQSVSINRRAGFPTMVMLNTQMWGPAGDYTEATFYVFRDNVQIFAFGNGTGVYGAQVSVTAMFIDQNIGGGPATYHLRAARRNPGVGSGGPVEISRRTLALHQFQR